MGKSERIREIAEYIINNIHKDDGYLDNLLDRNSISLPKMSRVEVNNVTEMCKKFCVDFKIINNGYTYPYNDIALVVYKYSDAFSIFGIEYNGNNWIRYNGISVNFN